MLGTIWISLWSLRCRCANVRAKIKRWTISFVEFCSYFDLLDFVDWLIFYFEFIIIFYYLRRLQRVTQSFNFILKMVRRQDKERSGRWKIDKEDMCEVYSTKGTAGTNKLGVFCFGLFYLLLFYFIFYLGFTCSYVSYPPYQYLKLNTR